MNEEELKKSFEQGYNDETKRQVLRDAKLQFKALIFLNHQTCRSCRFKILSAVRSGSKFEEKQLCPSCLIKYANLKGGQ